MASQDRPDLKEVKEKEVKQIFNLQSEHQHQSWTASSSLNLFICSSISGGFCAYA
jgi:hypothetical protein